MRAKVKGIWSDDPLWDSSQESPDSFCVHVRVLVGPVDGPGEESFDLLVCNPSYLSEQLGDEDVIPGRHYLFTKNLNKSIIENYLRKYIEGIEQPTWEQIAERVGRIGHWEFEDYVPARRQGTYRRRSGELTFSALSSADAAT